MEIINEYLNMFFKDGVPYLITQLVVLLQSWSFVFLIAFFTCRRPIEYFISRVQGVRFPGTEIIAQSKEISNKGLDTDAGTIERNSEYFLTKDKKMHLPKISEHSVFKSVLIQQEDLIKADLKDSPFYAEEILMRELASYQIAINYERIFNDIFKSQFDALEKLNSNKEGTSVKELIQIYEKAKKMYSEAYINFSFDDWFYFLTINDLVLQKKDKWYVTDKARAFVYYVIVQQRYDIRCKGL